MWIPQQSFVKVTTLKYGPLYKEPRPSSLTLLSQNWDQIWGVRAEFSHLIRQSWTTDFKRGCGNGMHSGFTEKNVPPANINLSPEVIYKCCRNFADSH